MTVRDYKLAFATRLTEAGATDPEQLGEQLALLLDDASARSRVLNTETLATAAAIAAWWLAKWPVAAAGAIVLQRWADRAADRSPTSPC